MEKKVNSEMEKEQHKSECEAHYDAADSNDKLVINLRDINRTMRFLYEGRESQKRILMILLEAAPITQRSLTERLGIQPGSASEVLAKLERGGLIARTESSYDRRTTDITLTNQGRLLAEEALKQRKVRHEEMFSCLTEDEKRGLVALLEKVNADWQERYKSIGEHSCCKHGRGHDREREPGHKHEHDGEHEPGHKHEHDRENEPGHKHEHDGENESGHKHEHDFEHEPGHKHEHDREREPGHKHGHDFEHEPKRGHESGHKDEHEQNYERNHNNEYFQSHNNERSGCDGNCQDCKHPCKQGIGRKEFSDEHNSGSHHQEK